MLGAMAELVPQFLGDERHNRVHQLHRLAQHESRDGPRLVLFRPVGALHDRLGELDIPVADHAPDELVERIGGLVQAEVGQGLVDRLVGAGEFTQHPLVDREAGRRGIEALRQRRAIHLGEARRVPQLGREVARALDPGRRQPQAAGLRCGQRRHGEAQRVGAVFVDQLQGIDHVPLGLGHLLALLVRHQPVQVDGAERHLLHEVHAHHHHAGDPEEQDVPSGDERAGRIVLRHFRRLVRPAQGRERPQGRAEPGVEHVGIAFEVYVLAVMRTRLGFRLLLGERHEHFLVRPVPGRNLVAPPELARHAPRLDVLHPAEEILAAALGHELHPTVARRRQRRLRELLGIGVPLLGEIGLDRHAAAIAVRYRMGVRLDLLDQTQLFHFRDDHLARLEAVEAAILLRRLVVHPRELVEDVDRFEIVPAADLEIVEVMCRRDLDRARALLRVGILVAHDGDAAADQRQHSMLADQMLPLRIVGMHGDAGIAQHCLGPCRGDHDELVGAALDRILEVPEMALHLARFDLEVGDRGQHLGVPVDQPEILVDQAFPVEFDENLEHGLRQALVHGEALAAPVARGAEPAELAGDRAARIGLPLPDLGEELLAVQELLVGVGPGRALDREADPLLLEVAHHHHLRGDAGMVGAGLPQHVVALHAAPADQNVLQRVVERMAHVQAARDVGRRDHDAIGLLRRFGMGAESPRVLPFGIAPGLDFLGVVGLVEHLLALNEKRHGCDTVAMNEGGAWGQRRVSRAISRST